MILKKITLAAILWIATACTVFAQISQTDRSENEYLRTIYGPIRITKIALHSSDPAQLSVNGNDLELHTRSLAPLNMVITYDDLNETPAKRTFNFKLLFPDHPSSSTHITNTFSATTAGNFAKGEEFTVTGISVSPQPFPNGVYKIEITSDDIKMGETEFRLVNLAPEFRITDVEFASEDSLSNYLIDFGKPLTYNEIRYLTPRIKYESTADHDMSEIFQVKIISPAGKLSTGKNSPTGYTYIDTTLLKKGETKTSLKGWGNKKECVYDGGEHKFEIYNQGKMIFQKLFQVIDKGITIEKVWTEHDVINNSEKGMNVHIKFSSRNRKGLKGNYSVYFYYDDGSPLKDLNNSHATADGNVAHNKEFIPVYENSDYNDMILFMPYSELHLNPGKYDLKFFVVIWDKSGAQATELERTTYYKFTLAKENNPPKYASAQ